MFNNVTATVVISRLRISNNGELKEIEGLCSKITPLDTEEGGQTLKSAIGKESQAMTSFHLFSHLEPLVAMISEM